ncbi:MAG TPA: exo-alpha-sialidase [Planctomycetaceae bacterium]|nr:exo-alpha-sialidase [Planctomycetaceae bacterium]
MSNTAPPLRLDRREFLSISGAVGAGAVFATMSRCLARDAGKLDDPIERVTRSIIFPGRPRDDFKPDGKGVWFHPRACVVPTSDGPLGFMTVQRATGSDYFHPVCWTTSDDLGKTWSEPRPVPGMGREAYRDAIEAGVCDVVPEYHAPTDTVLAMGHNVFYTQGRFFRDQPPRWPVYSARDAAGNWTPLARLEWNDPRGSQIYTCGCSQRVTLADGDLLIALSFGSTDRPDRRVTSVRCAFDGRKVTIKQTGSTLELRKKRGLLEPSLTQFEGRFWMTIRAEDDRAYVAVSDDGLQWSPQKAWTWDDGSPLVTSTTQQHWLAHADGLFLVYVRKAENNAKVFRWRSPLFLARVDTRRMCLLRETERVVFPLVGDGVKKPKHVALMGNFHVNHATPRESWITVGENLSNDGYAGDTLLARVRWKRPNR